MTVGSIIAHIEETLTREQLEINFVYQSRYINIDTVQTIYLLYDFRRLMSLFLINWRAFVENTKCATYTWRPPSLTTEPKGT